MCSVAAVMMWLPFSAYISATPLMRQIVRFGGAAGEHDLLGGRADQVRDLLAGFLHRLFGLPAKAVIAAGGVAEDLHEIRLHRLKHARIHRRRRVIVHVNRQFHCVFLHHVYVGVDSKPYNVARLPLRTRSASVLRRILRHVRDADARTEAAGFLRGPSAADRARCTFRCGSNSRAR